jgi:hypothetical protein
VAFSFGLAGVAQFKSLLALSAVAMGGVFGTAAIVWSASGERSGSWLCAVILGLYLAFFIIYGFYQVLFGSLQGRLIRPERRGFLLLMSTFVGTIPSVVVGWFLLRRWFADPAQGFGHIFVAAAVGFGASGLVVLAVREPAQVSLPNSHRPIRNLRWLEAICRDANLRWLLLICLFVSAAWMLAPHYQAFGRARFDAGPEHLTHWVITQSIAVGIFSLAVGPLADRRGNCLALRVLIFGTALSPLSALIITQLPSATAANLYWMVYLPLGLAPLVTRVAFNYALELCEPEAHPTYQSVTNLGLALPLVFSPVFGWLIDLTSFELVFALGAACVLLAGALTFWLPEPRYRLSSTSLLQTPPQTPE